MDKINDSPEPPGKFPFLFEARTYTEGLVDGGLYGGTAALLKIAGIAQGVTYALYHRVAKEGRIA
jgi:hypothetical protein